VLGSVILAALGMPQLTNTPRSTTRERKVKEEEAVKHSKFTMVYYRQESLRGVTHEVSHRHLSGKNERNGSGEKSEQQENPAEKLKNAGYPDKRKDLERTAMMLGRRNVEKFLTTVK
jgi:hypothetical protein